MAVKNNRRKISKDKTREKIARAAKELFSKKGYHNTSVLDIVQAVGMSAGSVYVHFKSKKDLFEEIATGNVEELRIMLKKKRQTSRSDGILERLEKVRETYNTFFDYVDEHANQFLTKIRGGFGVDEQIDEDTWRLFSSFANDLAEDFSKWKRKGIISGFNPVLLGHVVVGMSNQVAHCYLVEKKFTREEAIEALITINKAIFFSYLTRKGKEKLGIE
jgi:AcrR family transcriptional regulator